MNTIKLNHYCCEEMKPVTGVLLFILFFIGGCKKESFITSPDAQMSFSSDTLFYDTVFTSTGSITKFVRLYNNNDQKLRLTSVDLGGGVNSQFKINVDGLPGPASDLEIAANDSMYVFITVQVNPDAANIPFVIQDSLRIRFNNTERFVQLQAWGQNAHFIRNHVVTGNEIWTNDKPYVILDGLLVNKNAKLTIEKGSRLYFHADAPLLVDGTLEVKGEKYDSLRVRFRSDRLDEPYRYFPGSWPGIYFRSDSHDNIMEFAVISNAFQGVVVDQPSGNANPKLILNESIIENCFDAGLIAIRSDISAKNTLIANCGKNMIIAFGGRYDFTHITNVAYSNSFITHKDPVLSITNVFEDGIAVFTADCSASFKNCIFWGDDGLVKDEVTIRKEGSAPFSLNFTNSLWKVSGVPANITATAMINNQDPQFNLVETDKRQYDFRLKQGSPAISKGLATGTLTDLDGNPRKALSPDAGAFEKQ
ncbi:MAG TPA: choice-of-anchor Q domain-containing protein [Flavitalea sp.]|nr:choice-of-anchor Q domain-containing protein [Flavitalea sp.]